MLIISNAASISTNISTPENQLVKYFNHDNHVKLIHIVTVPVPSYHSMKVFTL